MRELTRFPAEVKAELLALVRRDTQARTGWTVRRILPQLGGATRRAIATGRSARPRTSSGGSSVPSRAARDGILAEERAAVLHVRAGAPEGWVSAADVADGGCGRRVPERVERRTASLIDADLLASLEAQPVAVRAPAPRKPGAAARAVAHGPDVPADRRTAGTSWSTVLDAYSRYVVHWELLTTMRGGDVRLRDPAGLGMHPGAHSDRLVTDNGSPVHGGGIQGLGAALRVWSTSGLGRIIRSRTDWWSGSIGRRARSWGIRLGSGTCVQARRDQIAAPGCGTTTRSGCTQGWGTSTPAEFYQGNPAARQEAGEGEAGSDRTHQHRAAAGSRVNHGRV